VKAPGTAERIRTRFHALYTVSVNKWYFDELIDGLIVRPTLAAASFARNVFEPRVIDETLVGGTSGIVRASSAAVRAVQSGFVRYYAALLVLGVAAIGFYFLLQS
jgi:NADH-quinone oxidoreductase subunit L